MKIKTRHNRLRVNQVTPTTNVIITLVMAIVAVATVFPILVCISISISSDAALKQYGYTLIPREVSFKAYEYLIKNGHNMWRAYGNTIFYALTGTTLSLFIMTMFAYVLSRKQLRWRYGMALYAYCTALFGGGLAASYVLTTRVLHLEDSIWVFIIPGLVSPFTCIVLRTFIQTMIPDELVESAKLDGASEFQIYARIVLPLFKAGIATQALFGIVAMWNEWFTGVLYIRNQKLVPIMTFLHLIEQNVEALKAGTPASVTAEGIKMLKEMPTESTRIAVMIFAIFPLLVSYPFFQKYFVKGITVGSVKG